MALGRVVPAVAPSRGWPIGHGEEVWNVIRYRYRFHPKYMTE